MHALKELPGAATESTNPKIDLTVGIIFIYIRVNFRLLSREYFNEMSPTDRVRFEKRVIARSWGVKVTHYRCDIFHLKGYSKTWGERRERERKRPIVYDLSREFQHHLLTV